MVAEKIKVRTEHLRTISKSIKNLYVLLNNIDNELGQRIHSMNLEGRLRFEVDNLWSMEHLRVMAMRDHAAKITSLLDKTAHDFEAADGKGAVVTRAAAIDIKAKQELTSKTLTRIELLHPSLRTSTKAFLLEAKSLGINLIITDSYRSFDEQNALYSKGRDDDGKIVTNAKGGQSYHNYGLAFDVVEVVDGKADWGSQKWDEIGALGKKHGFEWGGDFKSIVDKPHFQSCHNLDTSELLNKFENGDVDNQGFININK